MHHDFSFPPRGKPAATPPSRATPPSAGLAGLIRDYDWARTPLGSRAHWPKSLQTALDLCLGVEFPMSICWGPELTILFNDAFARLMPAPPEEVLGRAYFAYWGDFRRFNEPIYRRVLDHGESVKLENKSVRVGPAPESREGIFNISYSPLRDDRGDVVGVLTVAIEVTQVIVKERNWEAAQIRMENAFAERTNELTRSRAFLDSLIENLPNMVFVKDAKNLRFVRFNRAGEDLLGMDRSELIGKNDFDFFPPEQATHFVERDRDVLSGREIVDIPEEPIRTRHRGERLLHTRKIPLFDNAGNPEYLLGISDDITEKRLAEQERLRLSREEAVLAEREAANRRVSLLADASVTLADSLDFHVTLRKLAALVVPAFADWCTITVRERDGALARLAVEHRNPGLRPLLDELLNNYPPNEEKNRGTGYVIKTGEAQLTERTPDEALVHAAQSPRHLELMRTLGTQSCIVVPIRGREQVHGAIALMNGESQRFYSREDLRTAEELGRRAGIAIDNALLYREAQIAVSSRDAFLSVASHELKTPLTSLVIQTQMRRRHIDRENYAVFTPEKLLQMVESDARQLDRLTRLIDDMLDISRINSGKLTVTPEPVNLCQLVREVADRHAEQYNAAGCPLSFSGEEHVVGLWDRFRIEQVVTNLLTNALKYGAGKPVEITVREQGREALLEVRDHGIGIAPEDQERIFRQFERAVGASEVTGLGLGLYIVKQILDLHGGTIRVTSKPGAGSRFTVTLPAC